MKYLVLLMLATASVYAGTYFAFDGRKTTVDGVECVVVRARSGNGIGVSCNWGK